MTKKISNHFLFNSSIDNNSHCFNISKSSILKFKCDLAIEVDDDLLQHHFPKFNSIVIQERFKLVHFMCQASNFLRARYLVYKRVNNTKFLSSLEWRCRIIFYLPIVSMRYLVIVFFCIATFKTMTMTIEQSKVLRTIKNGQRSIRFICICRYIVHMCIFKLEKFPHDLVPIIKRMYLIDWFSMRVILQT